MPIACSLMVVALSVVAVAGCANSRGAAPTEPSRPAPAAPNPATQTAVQLGAVDAGAGDAASTWRKELLDPAMHAAAFERLSKLDLAELRPLTPMLVELWRTNAPETYPCGSEHRAEYLANGLKPVASLSTQFFPRRMTVLFGMRRLGNKSSTDCLTKLDRMIERDESAVRIPGARDLLGEERITAAILHRKE